MNENKQLTAIASQLALIVAAKRGTPFTRKVTVTQDTGGDLDVSLLSVRIHPLFFTEGNPIAVMEHVFDVCREYDEKHSAATRRAIIDTKYKLRFYLRELRRLDPESIQMIIEEELGLGEEEVITLHLADPKED